MILNINKSVLSKKWFISKKQKNSQNNKRNWKQKLNVIILHGFE